MNQEHRCLDHFCAHIGSRQVRLSEIESASKEFFEKIVDFNVRGQLDQIEHPGYFTLFKFCPECAEKISVSIDQDALLLQAIENFDTKGRAKLKQLQAKELERFKRGE